jgi:hypothetical protein
LECSFLVCFALAFAFLRFLSARSFGLRYHVLHLKLLHRWDLLG